MDDRVKQAVTLLLAVADAIKELGSVPSGCLYASLMQTGMSLETYTRIINVLKKQNLVVEHHHLLTWVGPL
jgi:hypothetical protein